MPKLAFNLIVLLFAIQIVPGAFGQEKSPVTVSVRYVSSNAIYINGGKANGLVIGDTLQITREQKAIASVIVNQLSGKSAACSIIMQKEEVQIGDIVVLPVKLQRKISTQDIQNQEKSEISGIRDFEASKDNKLNPSNVLRGSISLQNYWNRDMSGTRLSSYQPGLSGKLTIKNILGSGLTLLVRHRSRKISRSTSIGNILSNDWTHSLFQFALLYDPKDSPFEIGVGRVLSPYIRGIGYIDGVHFSAKFHNNFRVGITGGTEPDLNLSFSRARKKYGAFINFESGDYSKRRFSTTVALSASYESGIIDREFVYLQNNYTLANRFSFYQSVEMDINRKWRREAENKDLTFSNFYCNLNIKLQRFASVNFSYDARKNIRTYRSINTADSLFDNVLRQGLAGGFSLELPRNMQLRGNLSIRLQESGLQDNYFGSLLYQIRHFPKRGYSLTARFAYVNTQFTQGYRPTLNISLLIKRKISLNVSGGGYIYKTGETTISTYYSEVRTYYYFKRRYYFSGSYRQYFDPKLQSAQIFTEIGLSL